MHIFPCNMYNTLVQTMCGSAEMVTYTTKFYMESETESTHMYFSTKIVFFGNCLLKTPTHLALLLYKYLNYKCLGMKSSLGLEFFFSVKIVTPFYTSSWGITSVTDYSCRSN